MKGKTPIALAALVVLGITTAWSAGSRRVDLNGDGYKEGLALYSGNRMVTTYIDADRDGRFESTIFYSKSGHRERAESDLSGDGRTDTWVSYYFTGVPWKIAEDLNRDGRPDYWTYLKDGRVYKWEQDRDADGKADVRTTYEEGTGAAKTALVQQAFDEDRDGHFENLSGISIARKEATVPRSLAEALLR